MTKPPIKVLLVDDSPVALKILQRLIDSSSDVQVIATASNGQEALELIPKVNPNVICTDFHMKGMDGLALTQKVMTKYPIPILIISNSVQEDDPGNIFKLLQAGAIDVFPKPITGQDSDYERIKNLLITKIKVLSGVSVFTKSFSQASQPQLKTLKSVPNSSLNSINPTVDNHRSPIKVVTIGASTGGPKALHQIIAPLPKNFPVPIICTQHISPGFLEGLVSWLESESQLKIKIAQAGEYPVPGTVYFAPDNYHLGLNSQGQFGHLNSAPVDGHRPSVTAMFESVAKFYRQGTVGVLLTGMGRDGARGMNAIAQAGGINIAQDEKSCTVFGMPKEAIALGVVNYVLPLQEIAPFLNKLQRVKV
ncbi:chemotaxis-specific protein-glutamate methyltransferase CheB [Crocosphaera chwakensis]|uniref:Protein-glutamate methylesterase/protein-glutamine glutaminase n=1 Tax=Crocosphaera chwakensis CCY0110 TaxID=391612 RepID=A3IYC0_9CHRO|nr:chemotaxis-specific protein-glutamate methyltransferase CheB [Crocosphaera chwakensis]EAZ88528.1 response regulator receiver (CheY-like) modulated CheB methylesterase [Crocosphaera chwakensis CCY0110]